MSFTSPDYKSPDFKEKKADSADRDSESNDPASPYPQEVRLQRQLKNRHVAMISIGGMLVELVRNSDLYLCCPQVLSALVCSWVPQLHLGMEDQLVCYLVIRSSVPSVSRS
jgi:hypothetical protein